MPDFTDLLRERLRNAGLSPLRETEIVDEWAQHLADRYDALRASGQTHEDALRSIAGELDQRDLAAELRRVEQRWTEPVRLGAGTRGGFWLGLWQDVRHSLRVLRLNPGFALVCVVSLALGIGANTAIFRLLDAVRMRTLPVKHPEELAIIRPLRFWRSGHVDGRYAYSTIAQWEQVRARQQGFSGVFAWGTTSFNLATAGQARYADGLWVSGEFFDVLGVQPLLGRFFHPADDHPGCGAAGAVISYGFWQREFGASPDFLNRSVTLNGHIFPIIGVTPASFYGVDVGHNFDVAVPLCSEPLILGETSSYARPDGWWLAMLGRLKPGWSLAQASAQLQAISPGIMQDTVPPSYHAENVKKYVALQLSAFPAATGFSNLRREYETPLWLLLAIAGSVLLIACANLASLMLARASAREREIAVRLALGAARGRLVRQLLTESLLLAAAGALLGAALASALSRLLLRYLTSDDGSRIFLALATDWRVLSFTTAAAILTCLLFGLAPALKATGADPARVISFANRGFTATRERFSLRRVLVICQVALSMVLVVGALLFSGSLRKILTLDAGFQRDGILIMHVDFSRLNLPKAQRAPFAQALLDRVRAIPGVVSAAETTIVPLGDDFWNNRVIVDGKRGQPNVNMSHVTPAYFQTMGTPLLAGRDFDQRDTPQAALVAIVNQEFAKEFFGGRNPIGRTFKIDVDRGEAQPEYQVVGLVANSKYFDLREDFSPLAFYPEAQDLKPRSSTEVIVRSYVTVDSLLPSLRHAAADADPALSIDFHVFDEQVKEGLLRERLLATLSGFFGLLAAVLATVGLYGVVTYMVVGRTNEIGIRMALGATPRHVLAMVLSEASTLLLGGVIIGVSLSLAAGKSAASLLYGLKPYDPVMLAAASVGLTLVAIAASLLPARRAARLDPIVALREE